MYSQFITYLFNYIKYQEQIIIYLMAIIFGKPVARGLYGEPVDKPYRKLIVDDMTIIETLEKMDHRQLLQDYEQAHAKASSTTKEC